PMETMNIALPESMKQFVQERVSEGGYSSASEYVRELIRADQKRKVEERIDALLLEGLDSGEPIPVTPEHWEGKKGKLAERLGKAITPQCPGSIRSYGLPIGTSTVRPDPSCKKPAWKQPCASRRPPRPPSRNLPSCRAWARGVNLPIPASPACAS